MGFFASEKIHKVLPAVLLLAAVLFAGACSDDDKDRRKDNPQGGKTEVKEETMSRLTTGLETTGNSRPPEVTLGEDTGDETGVVIRLEGDPRPRSQASAPLGKIRRCWAARRRDSVSSSTPTDGNSHAVSRNRTRKQASSKSSWSPAETTRSVQQTNAPGGVIKVSYEG